MSTVTRHVEPRLADTLRNLQLAFELMYRRVGIDNNSDPAAFDTPEFERANEAAIHLIASSHSDSEDPYEVLDKFGVPVSDEVQGLLVLAFMRDPKLADRLLGRRF